jgi:hypothetical protein
MPVVRSSLANEKLPEDILEQDIPCWDSRIPFSLLDVRSLPSTPDEWTLLCIDADGHLYIVDVKKERTPRDVVAQTMDYGYWVRELGYDEIRAIYGRHRGEGADFDEAFREAFELEPSEIVNAEHQLVIVASALDAASERIVDYALFRRLRMGGRITSPGRGSPTLSKSLCRSARE